jgi:hypothetical protein
MRRFFVGLVLVLLVGSVSIVWGEFPRHVDPGEVGIDDPNWGALFGLYAGIFDFISVGGYDEALGALSEVDDLYASPEAREHLLVYNVLLRSVVSELNQSEISIGQAFSELFWLRESEAYASLMEAYPHIVEANSSTLELWGKSLVLADLLEGDPDRLLSGVMQVEGVVDELDILIQQGLIEVERITRVKFEGLLETRILLNVDDPGPVVGGEVIVSGGLSVDGGGLGGRVVEVMVEGVVVSSIVSDVDGGFSVPFVVSYRYVDSLLIQASYRPSVEDESLYTPSRSSVLIYPVFYEPSVSLNVPPIVFPGREYGVNGRVVYGSEPVAGVEVVITGFGSSIGVVTDSIGAFTMEISIPEEWRVGFESLSVVSMPDGVYGSGSVVGLVEVQRMGIEIETEKDLFTVSGFDTRFSGQVSSSGVSLVGCELVLEFGDEVFTEFSDADGRFSFVLPVSFIQLSTMSRVVLSVRPVEPWIESGVLEDSILVFNAFFVVPFFAVAGFLVVRRRGDEALVVVRASPIVISESVVYPEASGISGLYYRAVRVISRLSGVDLSPSSTIREYLAWVRPVLSGRVYGLFSQASRLVERWIYGPKKSRAPIRTAEGLVRSLEDEEDSA